MPKEFVLVGKTVNAEFYKGIMARFLQRIQRVRPAAFCSRDFFLFHENAPAHKAATVCQFDPKCVTTLYHPPPVLSRFISARLFSFPKLNKKFKRLHFADIAEIQEAIPDELKKVQKEEFSATSQNLYDRAKACIYANGAHFELKKCVFDF